MSAVLDLPKTTSIEKIYKAVEMARREQAAVILSNISWETYDRFVEETMDKIVNPVLYFENENLLIMVKSAEHEFTNDYIALFINLVCEEWRKSFGSLGSTTFRRDDLEKGFEPDSCFYFENEPKMRGVKRLDMKIHPAPDLIVEVDITSLSTFREHIFAAFGVPEIWRFDGEKMQILKLENDKYVEISNSLALPKVTPEKLTEFVGKSETLSRLEWISEVRDWARGNINTNE
jgi:Uma2 family endonuclease